VLVIVIVLMMMFVISGKNGTDAKDEKSKEGD